MPAPPPPPSPPLTFSSLSNSRRRSREASLIVRTNWKDPEPSYPRPSEDHGSKFFQESTQVVHIRPHSTTRASSNLNLLKSLSNVADIGSTKEHVDTSEELEQIRKLMMQDELDYYVVPFEDPHQSEHVAASDRRLEWISGFTGDAGHAIVSKTAAYLVTDARYWLQAREELDSNWYLIPANSVDGPEDWIDFLLNRVKNSKIGIDARMISHDDATRLIAKLSKKGSRLAYPPQNFVDLCWRGKPQRPKDPVFAQLLDSTGQDASSKLAEVQRWILAKPPSGPTVAQKHVGTLITSLSCIAYLLNLRGSDIPFNLLFYSYLFISVDKVILFLDTAKLTDNAKDHLHSLKVERREYNDIWPFLRRREWGEGKLLLSPETSYAISLMLTSVRYTVVPPYYIDNTKAVKNEVEFESLLAYLDDGAAYKGDHSKAINSLQAIHLTRDEHSNKIIAGLRCSNQDLCRQLAESRYKIDSLTRINLVYEEVNKCELLYARGRIYDAAESLLKTSKIANEESVANKSLSDWLNVFTQKCTRRLERIGDEASNADKQEEALAAYSMVLSLDPSAPDTALIKWSSIILIRASVHEALIATVKFKLPRFVIYRVICDILERNDRLAEAIECFREMQNKVPMDASTHDKREQWEHEYRGRCVEKLEKLGDAARDRMKHDVATKHYSAALLLDPANFNILSKCGNEIIELHPASHRGYEMKHAALHGMGHHSKALESFRTMLSKLEQSPDPQIRELRDQYIDATPTINNAIEMTLRHMPRVLIDTTSGYLYEKAQQAAVFGELPIYDELRSSMTTRAQLDQARIESEVKKFYSYVMLSHRWQPNEPTFQQVEKNSVYKLPSSPAISKLQSFCKLARTLRFKWAWSDTCCVNQLDKGVQQESLVAMFEWYRGSSLTIVHLLGVLSHSQEIGCLLRSIWNTRGWTYQEYVASEVVQFYTEDWKPYLALNVFNHKESPTILSEMEQATKFTTQQLAALEPGLDRVREKLFLASLRQTTRVEDIAYSLFGIFNVAIPVIYGEGDRAIGRLLEHILTGSGDVTILAWTGRAGSYNSCLPIDLMVYSRLMPPHVPSPIETAEMDSMVMELHSSLHDLSVATTLYDHLSKLPSPSVHASRLRLAGIVFPITEIVHTITSDNDRGVHVYRATTAALRDVEIRTKDNLSGTEGFVFIHPWISPLLDQDFLCRPGGLDDTTRALRLVARLRRPFGALLLKPLSRVQYRRIATDSLIMVQVHGETSLTELMRSIGTVDIQ